MEYKSRITGGLTVGETKTETGICTVLLPPSTAGKTDASRLMLITG